MLDPIDLTNPITNYILSFFNPQCLCWFLIYKKIFYYVFFSFARVTAVRGGYLHQPLWTFPPPVSCVWTSDLPIFRYIFGTLQSIKTCLACLNCHIVFALIVQNKTNLASITAPDILIHCINFNCSNSTQI